MGDYGQYDVPTVEQMVNFKVGQPAPSLLPLDSIRRAAANKLAEEDPLLLQYGVIAGYPKFRRSLAGFLEKGYKQPVDTEKLFVTNGVTGGLVLLCTLFTTRGDLVFAEEPSYFLALSIFKDFGLNVTQIPMDEQGLDLDALEAALQAGARPKLLYTIPTCHNPTGRTMPAARRQRLALLSKQYDFTIVADEVYQLLSFPHVTPPPPMFTYSDTGNIVALGSFSKILAPSLRLGWMQASEEVIARLAASGQLDSSGGLNPLVSGIVHSAIDMGLQQEHLDSVREVLWRRASGLMAALDAHLPEGCSYERPDGGYFILVRLPDGMSAAALLALGMAEHKIAFLPGGSFATTMSNYLRLSFSYYDPADLVVGAERLGEAIRALQAQMSSAPPPTPVAPVAAAASSSSSSFSSCCVPIAVHGAGGRLGQLVAAQAAAEGSGARYVGAVPRGGLPSVDAAVVVDVSLPEGLSALLQALLQRHTAAGATGAPALVVGTTGDLPMEQLQQYAKLAPVAVVPNFSVGVPLLSSLAATAAAALPQGEGWVTSMLEEHHVWKKDAPSGTALKLATALEGAGAPVLLADGSSGAGPVPCAALRLGDTVGVHTIYMAGPGERLELKHTATRRDVFAIGAVRHAKALVGQAPGLYQK